MKKWIFRISIILNILFVLNLFLQWFNIPSYKLGRLEKDLKVGHFSSDSVIFELPRGLTVRNISQRGLSAIGQFENERFEIVVTSEEPDLVNYNVSDSELQQFGNFYSADIKND